MLLATSSILMNQKYALNRMSLNKNTDKTKLCTDNILKCYEQRLIEAN